MVIKFLCVAHGIACSNFCTLVQKKLLGTVTRQPLVKTNLEDSVGDIVNGKVCGITESAIITCSYHL